MSDITPEAAMIQLEATQTQKPGSEALIQTMGASINYCIVNGSQVGDVVDSLLDEATFQSLRTTDWVLMNGQSVVGSTFESITGMSNVPDARGTVLRMKDHGAGRNTTGDLALGTYEADQNKYHAHGIRRAPSGPGPVRLGIFTANGTDPVSYLFDDPFSPLQPMIEYHGNGADREAKVKAITVNKFIRIN